MEEESVRRNRRGKMKPFNYKRGPQTEKEKESRRETIAKMMEKRRREKSAWFCQSCGKKCYPGERKFIVCEECFNLLLELKREKKV